MSFDRLAPVYRLMERLLAGDKLQRCRLAHLAQAQHAARKALLLGEGTGRFLIPLLQSNPHLQVTCVDASAGMIEQTRHALKQAHADETRVQFIHADIFQWSPAETSFDLIATHFFLDCFRADQLDALIPKLASFTTPDALWLLSDFNLPPTGLARLRAQLILWAMYRFFRLVTNLPAHHLTDCTTHLQQNGFISIAHETHEWGLLRSDCWKRDSGARLSESQQHT
ncbi:MAG TPA: class I SAM-dependent methyltransferase [Verrucomicrobiae bacterium]